MDRDRRKHKRIEQQFIARFQVRPHESPKEAFKGWDMVTVRNLSAGGVNFNYDKDLGVGSVLDFKVNFPDYDVPISCLARVLRVENAPYGLFHIAAEFSDIQKKEQKLIEELAEELDLNPPEDSTD
ncbi:MAG: hypothetical protein GF409_03470 [Candidatus Omnitrophica bacterium]|nr:hypothetical protein [Candidatus Omnitrophota bacterium]